MLSLCYEKTGKTDKVNDIVKDLARTYPGNTQNNDMLLLPGAR
jgi:hypothetical protein